MIYLRDFPLPLVIYYIVSLQKVSMDSGQHKQQPLVFPNQKKSYLRAMNPASTAPPQTPRYYNGGYRYFFNGQEADNEVLGEGIIVYR